MSRTKPVRPEKAAKLEELKEKFSRATSVVLVDFKGTSVEQITGLRAKMRAADVEYQVVKNTLARKALEGTDVAVLEDLFKGPTGVAIGYEDPGAPSKVLDEAAKDLEKMEFKGAMVEGQAYGPEAIPDLAKLPGKKDIQAMFAAMLQAPLSNFAGVLNAPLRDFVWVLDAKRRKDEEAGS